MTEEEEEYTPSTTAARALYQSGRVREAGSSWLRDDYGAEFDRWMAAHDAQVREQAAREVADQREAFLSSPGLDPAWIAGWHSAVDHVAARIARGETKGGE